VIVAVAALTTGVISDSRTVEAIKAFDEVNRIVCREDFEVNL